METTKTILILSGGVAAIALCVAYILFSLNRDASRFLKYFMGNTAFIVGVGLSFYLFPNAVVAIAIFALLGWVALIVLGSRHAEENSPETDDRDP